MTFNNFREMHPNGRPHLHMNFDYEWMWDTKNDQADLDNGFICKRKA